jgi:hypothetical protein
MAAHNKPTVSVQPPGHRPTPAERRAAQIASLSTRQAELKQEAAQRAAARANKTAPFTSTPGRGATARRGNAR